MSRAVNGSGLFTFRSFYKCACLFLHLNCVWFSFEFVLQEEVASALFFFVKSISQDCLIMYIDLDIILRKLLALLQVKYIVIISSEKTYVPLQDYA